MPFPPPPPHPHHPTLFCYPSTFLGACWEMEKLPKPLSDGAAHVLCTPSLLPPLPCSRLHFINFHVSLRLLENFPLRASCPASSLPTHQPSSSLSLHWSHRHSLCATKQACTALRSERERSKTHRIFNFKDLIV